MKPTVLTKLQTNRKQQKPAEQHWVGVSVIQELTKWDKEWMRKAREQNLIRFRDGEKGRQYLLESIPEQFIKKTA